MEKIKYKFEVYNDEGLLVANDLETLLELIEMAGYKVQDNYLNIEEEEENKK